MLAALIFELACASAHAGLVYKRVEGQNLTMDVYLPPGKGPFPSVVFIHGGAGGDWASGSKADDIDQTLGLLPAGVAVAAIDYRLASGVARWPAQGEDVRDAVLWVQKHGKNVGLDPEKVGCWGVGAGGHLCTWLTTSQPGGAKVGVAVDIAGPAGFIDDAVNGGTDPQRDALFGFSVPALLGHMTDKAAPWPQMVQRVASADPMTFVASGPVSWPGIFVAHGAADPVVPVKDSQRLVDAFVALGADYMYKEVPGGGHHYENWPPAVVQAAVSYVVAFLKPGAVVV